MYPNFNWIVWIIYAIGAIAIINFIVSFFFRKDLDNIEERIRKIELKRTKEGIENKRKKND